MYKINTSRASLVDITNDKVMLFYSNLKKTLNIYFRVYYDKTIFKVKKYKELYEELKAHPKVQLVEFECEYFKNSRNNKDTYYHINLFGTLVRFFPIFDNSSKKMEYYVIMAILYAL